MDHETLEFIECILNWWETNRRVYPWRKTSEPYIILITEILLRKTTATHVNSIYDSFFLKYPTIEKLAKTDKDSLKETILSLGLSNQRSEQLLKLSKTIVEEYNGKIPREYEDILNLPGVGKYTAGALMCVSYKSDEAMVDTNVVRVVGRYFDFKSDKKEVHTDVNLWDFVRYLIPKGRCKEFNLGIIDFANSICLPRIPKCKKCPLNNLCKFYNENTSFLIKNAKNLAKKREFENAISALQKILEKESENINALYLKADILRKMKKIDDSIELFHKILEIYPDNAGMWYELGITYQKIQDHSNAIKSFKKAISCDINLEWALNSMAISLAMIGKPDEALKSVNKYLEIHPEDVEADKLKRDILSLIKENDIQLNSRKQ